MRPFLCSHCQHTVFFENSHCGQCGSTLGFVPADMGMAAFELPPLPGDGSATPVEWVRLDVSETAAPLRLRPCANRLDHGLCNWMLDADDGHTLCRSCRLTQVIPSLDNPVNLTHWTLIERAKRRLVFTLTGLGLAPEPKSGPGDKLGLAFHLLESLPGQVPVLTSHGEGLITLNIAEADDLHREAARVSMREPIRTLLGHLRHEVSHYLQQRYIDGTPAIEDCRAIFGDEREPYDVALQNHYVNGAPPDWPTRFVSAYASSHPWEDWAETCAHYLLVIDAVQTASSWGLQLSSPAAATHPTGEDVQQVPVEDLVLQHWLPVAQFLNAMNRSMGLPDSYPFLLPPLVLQKMATVQRLLSPASQALLPSSNAPLSGQASGNGRLQTPSENQITDRANDQINDTTDLGPARSG